MLISYPILPNDADIGDAERDTAFSDHYFPDPPHGAGSYPFSASMRWHGGVHIQYGAEPIRAIADGKVVFVRSAEPKSDDRKAPLNYGFSWTDNGCVVIEHDAETGEHTKFKFWSVYMHLSKTMVKNGVAVSRKDIVGKGGLISGSALMHFEIFMDESSLSTLIKRGGAAYKVFDTKQNGGDLDLWGDMHFVLPAGTKIFDKTPRQVVAEQKAWKERKAKFDAAEKKRVHQLIVDAKKKHEKLSAGESKEKAFGEAEPSAPIVIANIDDKDSVYLSIRLMKGRCISSYYKKDVGLQFRVEDPDLTYEYRLNALAKEVALDTASAAYELLRFGRVVGPDTIASTHQGNWKYIGLSSSVKGYVDLSDVDIIKLSDADFPAFLGWSLVAEGEKGTSTTSDGSCDPRAVLALIHEAIPADATQATLINLLSGPAQRKKLRRLICEFKTEWDRSDFDEKYCFLQKDGVWPDGTNRDALTLNQYNDFKAHANDLQWWSDANINISEKVWHFHPIEFINILRSCRWLSEADVGKIYPTTSPDIRERYRVSMNKVMQKYNIISAARQAHFLGQGAIESSRLTEMIEASTGFVNDKPTIKPMSKEPEQELGHWYGAVHSEFDDYYSIVTTNNGKKRGQTYSWKLGNVGNVDAQKFRGRGFKQLTGRANYADYWIYRGWLSRHSFDASWWSDQEYEKRNAAAMTRRPAVINDPEVISEIPYNCMDSGGFFLAFIKPDIKINMDKAPDHLPVSNADADFQKVSREITVLINGKAASLARERFEATIFAYRVLA